MKNLIVGIIGRMISVLRKIHIRYYRAKLYADLGAIGYKSSISYPCEIVGSKNIYIGDNVSIRSNSMMSACNAKIVIKDWTIIAPYLYISTGNHMMTPGKYTGSIKNEEKDKEYDKDVIINEDVWIAAKVTILMGVNVGRGSVIAAGALVNKDVLPYSVVGGVPAKFIKFKWSLDQIIKHEEQLYPMEERFSREELINMGIS